MAIYHEDIVNIELECGNIHRSFMKHSIGSGDSAANRFGIRVLRNGEEVDLSGCSCYGYFQDPHGNNIALTSYGTINGAVAYVTLPQACYNYEGQFCMAIKLIGDGVTGTMRIVDGMVDNTHTGSAVAPTSAVPTYSEILSQYDAMVAATAAANGCIAETFDATKAYRAGKYVINSGALYRLTADHAANTTWANTSKVEVKFGNELSDTKSAVNFKNVDGIECFIPVQPYNKTTYRGIEVETSDGFIRLNGTGNTGHFNVKMSNDYDYRNGTAPKDAWYSENIPLIDGHTYSVNAVVESGSITNPDGNILVVVLRGTNGTTTSSVTIVNEDGTVNIGYLSGYQFVADSSNHAFMYFAVRNGVTYNNIKFRIVLVDETVLADYINRQYRFNRIEKIEPTGYTDILDTAQTTEYGGLSISKNTKAISNGNIVFDGTATQNIRLKITKGFDGRAVTIPESWLTERLNTITGHKYQLFVMCVGGTYSNEADEGVQFTLRKSDNSTLSWVKNTWSKGDVLTGNVFIADGTEAFVVVSIADESVFDNLEFKVCLYDITISDATNTEMSDGLADFEERQIDSILAFTDDWHYQNVTLTKGIYTNTDGDTTHYYLVTIPKNDAKGNIIPLTADYDANLSPMNHAIKNKTTVTANAGMVSGGKQGAVIHDGTVVHESEYSSPSFLVYVGFNEEREATEYPVSTTAQAMINDGVKNACIAYYRLVTSGVVRDVSEIGLPATNLKRNPRNSIFVKENGDVCFLACDGRYTTDAGLLPSELGELMVTFGAVDGWNLDGGGSTSLSFNGVKQNKHIDNNGTTDRNIHVTWNVPGITPDYILPECDKTESATYKLICTVTNGEKHYEWVLV